MDSILCDELLEEVLRRLPPRCTFSRSTSSVSLVSKRWLRLYRSFKSHIFLRLSPHNNSISSFFSHFPHLHHLYLIVDLPHDHPHDHVHVTNFSDQILLSLASSCPKLRTFHLKHGPVSLFPLLSLSTSCPRLGSLHIALSRPFSFHWLLSSCSLSMLTLDFTSVPGEFPQLDDNTSKRVNFDAELKLETVALDGIQRDDCGFDSLWRSCKNLKKLELHRCEGIGTDSSASSFINCLDGLEEVELWWCGSVVNDFVMRLVENCASLKSLLIRDKVEGSREGLFRFITQSSCNLRKLDLRLSLDLEDNHLLALAEKFRGLSCLRLSSCFLVTAEGLRTMVLAMSNKLEELALVNCKMEPGLLTTLGQRNLTKLDLSYNNDMLGDEEFISMLALCSSLRELSVRGCEGLTDASMVSMFKSCKKLQIIDIMNCPGIGAEAVEFYVLNCLQLTLIYVEESKISDVSRSWYSKKFFAIHA